MLAASRAFAADVQRLAQQRSGIPLRILGPAPMNIAMVNNHYRYKLTLKCRNDNAFRALMGGGAGGVQRGRMAGKSVRLSGFPFGRRHLTHKVLSAANENLGGI